MKCSACRSRLAAYQDGELSHGDAVLIAGHIAACAECSAAYQRMASVETMLEGFPGIEPANAFTAAVMAKIAALPVPRPSPARLWWIGAYVVAAWAVLAALVSTRTIIWQSFVAVAAGLVARIGVAGVDLLRVAQHLHLLTYAALGVAVEISLLVVLGVACRKYLSRLIATPSGA